MKETNRDLQCLILELRKKGMSVRAISIRLRVAKSTIGDIIKRNRLEITEPIKKASGVISILKLISPRLLYFCEDMELLSKRLAIEVLYQKPELIVVPSRLQRLLKDEKINKIVNILDRVNVKCNLKYANA